MKRTATLLLHIFMYLNISNRSQKVLLLASKCGKVFFFSSLGFQFQNQNIGRVFDCLNLSKISIYFFHFLRSYNWVVKDNYLPSLEMKLCRSRDNCLVTSLHRVTKVASPSINYLESRHSCSRR